MFALVLVGALVAQSVFAAPPTNCVEFCDEQSQPIHGNQGYRQSKSSYSSYAKSSSYNSHGARAGAGSTGLGHTGANLETFDENVIGTPNLDRPGTWRDEKSYVTNDGKGKIDYRAGQEVYDNGYSKFAEHSYSYSSKPGSHAPLSNSHIINSLDFDSQIQNIQSQISKFMGEFKLGTGFTVDQQTLDNFKVQAGAINNYMDSVCNSMDTSSANYQQIRQMVDNFRRETEQMKSRMESMYYSSTVSSQSHGSMSQYPRYQTPVYSAPSHVVATTPRIDFEEQRIDQECSQLRNEIDVFYNTYNRANYETFNQEDSLNKFRENAESQIALINQKLTNLRFESAQHESMRQNINQMITQFESYSADIKRRTEEVQTRIHQEQQRLREEFERQERENLRRLENERLQKEREIEDKKNALIAEEQKLLESKAKYELQIRQEQTRLAEIKKQEEDLRTAQEQERYRQQQQESIRIQQENLRIQQQRAEQARLLLQQQQQQLQQQQEQVTQVVPTVSVGGSVQTNYEYTHKTQLTASSSGSANGALIHQQSQPQARPHVDMTAMINRLQQNYNRLQNEVNSINTFTMRLTTSNAQSLVGEAESQVNQLRQNIDNLCQQSGRYQNYNLQKMAEDLKVRLESLYRDFESQAQSFTSQASSGHQLSGGYQSGSSWSSSAKYGQVKAPAMTNVEYTHSKSTEVEVGHRPASSQRYRNQHQQVDCVESYSGQPCVQEIAPTRSRRHVGDGYGSLFDNSQQHQPIFDDYLHPSRDQQFRPYAPRVDDYTQQRVGQIDPGFDLSSRGLHLGNGQIVSDDYSQRTGPVELPREHQPLRTETLDRRAVGSPRQQGRSFYLLDITRPGALEEFLTVQNVRNQVNLPMNLERQNEDLSQQHVDHGQNEDLDSYQKPRSQKSDFELRRTQLPRSGNSEVDDLNKADELDILQKTRPSSFGGDKQENISGNQQSKDFSLEKSGFYDTPRRNINSQPEITTARSSQNVVLIGGLTLEKSGFNDYPQENKRSEVTENPYRFQSLTTTPRPAGEDFNLENSGFYDSNFNQNTRSGRFDQRHENEDSVLGNGRLDNSEVLNGSDLNQQTAGQINFGSDSQLGRQASSSNVRNTDYNGRNGHPVGQYMDNINPPRYNQGFENSNQESLSTVRPLIKPAPKPIPRYTRPWQVSNIDNVPKQTENSLEKQFENENASLDNKEKQKVPLRGDIPGISEPTSTSTSTTTTTTTMTPPVVFTTAVPPLVVYTTPASIIKTPDCNDCPTTLGINESTQWWMNKSENNQFSQRNLFNQQNYRFSQQSNFESQHSFRTESDHQIQNPLNEYNSGIGLDDQTQKIQFNQPEQGSIFNYREQETNKFKLEHQQGFDNVDSNRRNLFNFNEKPLLTQQSRSLNSNQEPLLNQQSTSNFNDGYEGIVIEQGNSQTTADDFAQSVIPLETLRPMDEYNTTPRTFWKRIGQKLSNSIDKARERARTIFG